MKIVIYGAGVIGRSFVEALKEEGKQVDFFIDQKLQETSVDGIPIFNIKNIPTKECKIYVSAYSDSNIPSFLKDNLFFNVVSFVDSLKEIKLSISKLVEKELLWMRKANQYFLDLDKINIFQELLKDKKSKEALNSIVGFRKTLDMSSYPYPDENEIQYFPSDIDFNFKNKELDFIDCGAFIGDTLLSLLAVKSDFKLNSIVCFEPDVNNLKKLEENVNKQAVIYDDINIYIVPSAVWDNNEIINFTNDGSSSSVIINVETKNSTQISAFKLDTVLAGAKLNYIKMDIEGAEINALNGAKKIIAQQTPILAICLYHKPSDLWEIPLLINKINSNYDMFLRIHGHMGLETVLYCVPKKTS